MTTQLTVCDVGPRDGLQNEPVVLPVDARSEFGRRLATAGLPRVEITSFVNAARVPQMADADMVVDGVQLDGSCRFQGLVLNIRGYERLVETGLRQLVFAFAATDTFNQHNTRTSVDECLEALASIFARAHDDGVYCVGCIGASFGCPYEGTVDPGWVLELAGRVVASGADELLFGDSIGVAVPSQVRQIVTGASQFGVPVGGHFHDTRNTGIANAWAAVEAGATVLDASLGGIGGCPFAPNATGNIATEDLVYLLDKEGVNTGIDLDALIEAARWLEAQLEHPVPGSVCHAGGFPTPAHTALASESRE
jgi:hydroxymethylglutaryl-CoA lyase